MTFAETLSSKERIRGQRYAYFACLFGCVSEVMLDSSAIIIIYFTMLDGGDMLTMLGSSFSCVCGALLYIPASVLGVKVGLKPVVRYSCMAGCVGFLLMAAAPFFGLALAKYIALAGCFLYSLQRNCYGAAWYPLLDVFLRPQDRARFFGMMRFFYSGFTGILFFIIGLIMKLDPPMIFMQAVIGVTGLLILGRYWCISRFPEDPHAVPEPPEIRKGLSISIKNGPLTSYSVYIGLLLLFQSSLLPLTYLYLNKFVQMNPGTIQVISSIGLGGFVVGYFCYGRFLDKIKLKYLELTAHLIFMLAAFILFAVEHTVYGYPVIVSAVVFAMTFAHSLYMCNNSAELLALARPGNKTMAMAFVQSYTSGGGAISRIGVSLILGTSMLAPVWNFCGMEISHYQTLFLICGVMLMVLLFLLPTLPSFIPEHEDYYEPKK